MLRDTSRKATGFCLYPVSISVVEYFVAGFGKGGKGKCKKLRKKIIKVLVK